MADQTQKFRSALNGFNREDVVQFIQSLTARHDRDLSDLKEENARLQSALDKANAESDALRQRISELEIQLAEANESLEAATAPQSEPEKPDWGAQELAAYRRAEEVERQSRERAKQLHRELTGLVADASVQMDEANEALSEAMAQLTEDLTRLQTAMAAGKKVLNDTSCSLRASGGEDPA